VAESVGTAVSTDLHAIQAATTTDDLRDDPTLQQTDSRLSNSVIANEEDLNESTSLTTAHQDTITSTITQMEQKMEPSHRPDSLLDISNTPIMVAHATVDFISQKSNNFLKGCKWYDHNTYVECYASSH